MITCNKISPLLDWPNFFKEKFRFGALCQANWYGLFSNMKALHHLIPSPKQEIHMLTLILQSSGKKNANEEIKEQDVIKIFVPEPWGVRAPMHAEALEQNSAPEMGHLVSHTVKSRGYSSPHVWCHEWGLQLTGTIAGKYWLRHLSSNPGQHEVGTVISVKSL